MVKTPKTRHSKPQRAPVTIELEANREAVETPVEAIVEADAQPVETVSTAVEESVTETIGERERAASSEDVRVEEAAEERVEEEPARTGGRPSYAYEPQRPQSAPAVAANDGRWSRLGAGLLGGVAALALAGLLQAMGLIGASGGDSNADAEALRAEITTLKSSSEQAIAGLTTALDQARAEIVALQGAAGQGSGEFAARLQQLEQGIAALSAQGAGQSEQVAAELSAKIAALEQAVANIGSKVDSAAVQPKIALAISSAALRSAIERGTPFEAELETIAAIAPGAPQIEPLRAFAAQGVPTREAIAKGFPAAANAMVAASQPNTDGASFIQKLLDSAESVVKVRPVGEVAGDGPGERVARMEVAVNAGDYAKAVAEFDSLPDVVKAAGAQLVDQIKARMQVEKLLDELIAGAMKAA